MSDPTPVPGDVTPARPKPSHDWRAIATELAIVVFGVLIALGAQQLVDAWRTRGDVADFRAALKSELAANLGSYQGRIMQSACVASRLDQLEAWQTSWRTGRGSTLGEGFGRPLAYTLQTSVWRTGAASTATKMPLKERLAFAQLYDDLDGYDGLRKREVATWQALFAYDGAARLTSTEVNTLRGLILSARSTDRSIRVNWQGMLRQGAALGVRPAVDPAQRGQDSGLCDPLRVAS